MTMNDPDIICIVFDILTSDKDPVSILRCKYVCKLWYSAIQIYKRKYIKNSEVFTYMIAKNNNFRNSVSRKALSIWQSCEFHSRLTASVREFKYPKEVEKFIVKLINYVPNESVNFLSLSRDYEPHIENLTKEWTQKFFKEESDLILSAEKLTMCRNSNTIKVYDNYYKHQNTLNKILWIFILINSNDDDIQQLFGIP